MSAQIIPLEQHSHSQPSAAHSELSRNLHQRLRSIYTELVVCFNNRYDATQPLATFEELLREHSHLDYADSTYGVVVEEK